MIELLNPDTPSPPKRIVSAENTNEGPSVSQLPRDATTQCGAQQPGATSGGDANSTRDISATAILLFEKAYDAYQQDNERYWKMFNYMTAINGGLLAATVAANPGPHWILGLVGLALCFVWGGLQRRYAWWCNWWGEELAWMETILLAPEVAVKREKFRLPVGSTDARPQPLRPGEAVCGCSTENAIPHVEAGLPQPFHRHRFPGKKPDGFSTKYVTIAVPGLFAIAWIAIAVTDPLPTPRRGDTGNAPSASSLPSHPVSPTIETRPSPPRSQPALSPPGTIEGPTPSSSQATTPHPTNRDNIESH